MEDIILHYAPRLQHWLILTTALFSMGLYGLLTRKNAIGILMGVELMLNAVAINFVVFNYYVSPLKVEGQIMMLFIVAVAAAEAVVAIAIFISLYSRRKTLNVQQMNTLRG